MFSYRKRTPDSGARRGGPVELKVLLPNLIAKLVAGSIEADLPSATGARSIPPLPRAA